MRRLGAELGVDPTAVYRHFRYKDELLVAMADRMFAHSIDALELGRRLAREPAPDHHVRHRHLPLARGRLGRAGAARRTTSRPWSGPPSS